MGRTTKRRTGPRLRLMVAATSTVIALSHASACSPDGDDRPQPDVNAPPESGIAGYLFQDRNGDGVQGRDERALANWPVRVHSTGPLPLVEIRTNDRGVFELPVIENVTPGETTVSVRTQPVMEGPAGTGMPDPSALAQTFTAPLGGVTTIPVASYRMCLSSAECPDLQFPDLAPQLTTGADEQYPPPTVTYVDSTTIPDTVLLRFATSTANLGGLLHITAGPVGSAESEQSVQQRLYGDGVVLIQDAGSFVYHPEHHHFHVGEFVRYELLSSDQSEVLRTSEKVSFCLTDVLAADPPERPDGALFLDLKPFDCGVTEQGINSGFADYYGSELPDQWLDVTGLPSGRYWVRFTVDPQQRLLESDRSNNVATFEVELDAPAG